MEKQLLESLNKTFEDFKAVNDQREAEVKKLGEASAQTLEKLDKINTTLEATETKLTKQADERDAKLNARISDLEAKIGRKGSSYSDDADGEKAKRKANFFKALRHYHTDVRELLGAEEAKALTIGADTAGGYTTPSEFVAEILTEATEYSPIRSIARTRPTSRTEVLFPKRTGTAAAVWVGEQTTRAETQNPSFGLERIPTHEITGLVKISKQDLEDNAFDMEAFVRAELAEQFGVSEGTAFVSGTGVAQPEGFLTNASVGNVVSGNATLITADGMIALLYELKEVYLQNSTFTLSRSTMKTIRQLKDSTGNYLWAAGIRTDGRPATILDRPYITCPDMPTVGAGTYPVALGDFRRAYLIVDRLVMEVTVDPYTSKSTGMVEYSARRRVGAQVVLAEAIKKLKIAAA